MRLTIVPSDNMVAVDGRSLEVDLKPYETLLSGQHAVQWFEDKGHIEFLNHGKSSSEFKPNEPINSIEPYQAIIKDWEEAARLDTIERVDMAKAHRDVDEANARMEAKAKAMAEQMAKIPVVGTKQ